MRAVTVPVEVRIVFIQTHSAPTSRLRTLLSTLQQNAFARPVKSDQAKQIVALWRREFGVGVVVVKTRTVVNQQVAFEVLKRDLAIAIALKRAQPPVSPWQVCGLPEPAQEDEADA